MALQLRRAISKFTGILLLSGGVCFAQSASPDTVDRAKVAELSTMFLRDSAELPMDVAVTTVVTDPGGHEKRRSQSTVHFLFHGYRLQTGRFSFNSHSGWFSGGANRDSMTGDLAVISALGSLATGKNRDTAEIRPTSGQDFQVRIHRDCGYVAEASIHILFPSKYCKSVEFSAGTDSGEQLEFKSFTLEIDGFPAAAKVAYLGAVQIQSFRAEGDFQKAYIPGDQQPFLVPKRVVTTVETDKGEIVLTNTYTLTTDRARKN